MGVLHRDIKPENFLFSSGEPDAVLKLVDFGLSTFFNRGKPECEICGSPSFVRPHLSPFGMILARQCLSA